MGSQLWWDKLGAGKQLVCLRFFSPCFSGYSVTLPELPQFLYQAGWADNGHVIACTQPRRVAATSVAARVATELGTTLGNEVRFTLPTNSARPYYRELGRLHNKIRRREQQGLDPYPVSHRRDVIPGASHGPSPYPLQCHYGS